MSLVGLLYAGIMHTLFNHCRHEKICIMYGNMAKLPVLLINYFCVIIYVYLMGEFLQTIPC